MKQKRFDALTRSLSRVPSRRHLLRGLAAAGLGLGMTRIPGIAEAKKKRHHKKRTQKAATPNSFGCIDVGDLCQTATQCCSGICDGKKGRKTCRAHDSGNCAAGGRAEGCGGTDVACITSSGEPGLCGTTTGNAGYCLAGGFCVACQTDAECRVADGGVLGPRAACIQCAGCTETGGTACATPIIPGGVERHIS